MHHLASNTCLHDTTEQHVHLWLILHTRWDHEFHSIVPQHADALKHDKNCFPLYAGAAACPEALYSRATGTRNQQTATHKAAALCPAVLCSTATSMVDRRPANPCRTNAMLCCTQQPYKDSHWHRK